MAWIGLGFVAVLIAASLISLRLCRLQAMVPQADLPNPFGYKMSWLAVQSQDTARLIEVLRLEDVRLANWSTGIGTVYSERFGLDRVFVTPPLDGWSFVVGLSLPQPRSEQLADKCLPLLKELSREFEAVQYYISYPELEFYGWAALSNGKLLRAFVHGREGVVWNCGGVTADERRVGVRAFAPREVSSDDSVVESIASTICEAQVLAIAARWCLDPSQLDERGDLQASAGYVARTPRSWQSSALSLNAR